MKATATSADALDAVTVLDTRGATVPLRRAWGDHPAVLVFLRHFG